MFSMYTESKMAGPGYVILNIMRVFNIIALLTVAVASWVMLVMTVKGSTFFFFDGVSHFIASVLALFLIISELNLFSSYFARNWPVLSPQSGFVYLGLAMIVLGFNILGNLNKGATSASNMGLPSWRIVIAAGIITSLMGLFNIIATFIFCNSKLGITGRQVRSHGAAIPKEKFTKSEFSISSGSQRRAQSPILPSYHTTSEDNRKSRFGIKLPIRMTGISRPVPNDPEQFRKWDARSSPVVPDIQRPPTALHPAYHHPPPPPASSRYSEVSDMTRF